MSITKILQKHQLWLDSNGKEGERSNLPKEDLDDIYLSIERLKKSDNRWSLEELEQELDLGKDNK